MRFIDNNHLVIEWIYFAVFTEGSECLFAKTIVFNKLGIKEYTNFKASGNYKIKVSGAGLGGFGMGTDSTSGIADGKNYFYIVGVKQSLFSTKFTIRETTESGFNSF